MIIHCAALLIVSTASAIQHPTGFTTVEECVQKGASVHYLLEDGQRWEDGKTRKQFVLTLEQGVVVREGGIVTNDGKILADTETYKRDQQRLLAGKRDISTEEKMFFEGTLAVISTPGQQCYHHWLLQAVPRLKILADSHCPYDKIYVYAGNLKHRWQKDALYTVMDYLAIPHNKLLFVEDDTIVQAQKLLVPSVPWNPWVMNLEFWTYPFKWYKKFFNDVFVCTAQQTPKRIFISRAKAPCRRIRNEEALMELLAALGFVSYSLEDLSIQEQATLFKNAEVIVGPHGAGWTNLIFCKPGTKIIEIDHGVKGGEEDQRSVFKGMAKWMGCAYYPFYTDLVEPTDYTENIHEPINHDMTVDCDAFERLLRCLLP